MSLTSTSSDSEQVSLEDFLESCRAPTLLGDLDDDDEMDDDENVSFPKTVQEKFLIFYNFPFRTTTRTRTSTKKSAILCFK